MNLTSKIELECKILEDTKLTYTCTYQIKQQNNFQTSKKKEKILVFLSFFSVNKHYSFYSQRRPQKNHLHVIVKTCGNHHSFERVQGFEDENKLSLPEVLPKLELNYWNSFLNFSTDCPALLLVGSRTSAYLKSAG